MEAVDNCMFACSYLFRCLVISRLLLTCEAGTPITPSNAITTCIVTASPSAAETTSTTSATVAASSGPPRSSFPAVAVAIVPPGPVVLHRRPRATPNVLGQGVVGLAHLRVAQMHLAVEMVGQAAVVIQPGEVGAADVADLELLVAGGTGGVGEGLELALALHLGLGGLAHLEELVVGAADLAQVAEDLDLLQAAVDGVAQVGDGLQQHVGLADLVGGLLEAALGGVDAPVALLDVLLQVPGVVDVEAVLLAGGLGEGLVFGLERLGVDPGARA